MRSSSDCSTIGANASGGIQYPHGHTPKWMLVNGKLKLEMESTAAGCRF